MLIEGRNSPLNDVDGKGVRRDLGIAISPKLERVASRASGDARLIVVTASALVEWATSVPYTCSFSTTSSRGASDNEVEGYGDSGGKAMATAVCEDDQCAAQAPVRLYLGTGPPLSCAARTRIRYRSPAWTGDQVMVAACY